MNGFIKKEKCLLITALLISFSTWGRADSIILKNGKTLDPQEVNTSKDFYTLQYGMVTIHYGHAAIEQIAFNKPAVKERSFFTDPLLATTAEAYIPPENEVIQASFFAHRTIKQASHLQDLRAVLTNSAYQTLETQIQAGAKEINLLELLKNFIPENLTITKVQIDNDKAKIAVSGKMGRNAFAGIVEMTKENGAWKLQDESWYGDDQANSSVKNSVKLTDLSNVADNYSAKDLAQWYDPYASRKNTLHLKRAPLSMPKDSLFFFFYINHDAKRVKAEVQSPPEDLPQLHLAWSGSFKTLEQQKIHGRYPLDLSVAQEKDGYMPGTMNLRLPKAKPKQVYVGVLYAF